MPGFTASSDQVFADDIHLAALGLCLAGLVHRTCILGTDPRGKVTCASSGPSTEQAAFLHRIARSVRGNRRRGGAETARLRPQENGGGRRGRWLSCDP